MSNYCTEELCGVWTPVDIANAQEYSKAKMKEEQCKDPKIIKHVCGKYSPGPGANNCIEWAAGTQPVTWQQFSRTWAEGPGCTNDQDCSSSENKKLGIPEGAVCQFSSNDKKGWCHTSTEDASQGQCHIMTPELCNGISKLPYKCDGPGLTGGFDPAHRDVYSCSAIEGQTCKTSKDCNDPNVPNANLSGVCVAGSCQYPYTEWHTNPIKQDKMGNPAQFDGKPSPGMCIPGNYALRQWAENPGARPGAEAPTDFPLYYNKDSGEAYLTYDYCRNAYGSSYAGKTCKQSGSPCPEDCVQTTAGENTFACSEDQFWTCSTDADCKPTGFSPGEEGANPGYCHKPTPTGPGHCVSKNSDCYIWAPQAILEFTLGKTFFRAFQPHTACSDKDWAPDGNPVPSPKAKTQENFTHKKEEKTKSDLFQFLQNSPDSVEKLADSSKVKNSKIVVKKFAGDVPIRLITWKNGDTTMGFLAEDVRKKYPEFIVIKNGEKFIRMEKSQVKDQATKRLFYSLNSENWITDIIKNLFNFEKPV